jgi:hypothetical protein
LKSDQDEIESEYLTRRRIINQHLKSDQYEIERTFIIPKRVLRMVLKSDLYEIERYPACLKLSLI